jgi:uncharacterized membrane protein
VLLLDADIAVVDELLFVSTKDSIGGELLPEFVLLLLLLLFPNCIEPLAFLDADGLFVNSKLLKSVIVFGVVAAPAATSMLVLLDFLLFSFKKFKSKHKNTFKILCRNRRKKNKDNLIISIYIFLTAYQEQP